MNKSCLGVLIGYAIVGWILMMLWNWLLVDLVEFPEITFWQSLGVMILFRLFAGYFKK